MALGSAGANIVLVSRDLEQLNTVKHAVESAGGKAHVFPADVSDEEQVRRLKQEVLRTCNGILVEQRLAYTFARGGALGRTAKERAGESLQLHYDALDAADRFLEYPELELSNHSLYRASKNAGKKTSDNPVLSDAKLNALGAPGQSSAI